MGTEKRIGSGGPNDGSSRGARQAWSLEVRQRVVRAVVEQGLPLERVARSIGVPGTTAAEWVRKYRQGGLPALEGWTTVSRSEDLGVRALPTTDSA